MKTAIALALAALVSTPVAAQTNAALRQDLARMYAHVAQQMEKDPTVIRKTECIAAHLCGRSYRMLDKSGKIYGLSSFSNFTTGVHFRTMCIGSLGKPKLDCVTVETGKFHSAPLTRAYLTME